MQSKPITQRIARHTSEDGIDGGTFHKAGNGHRTLGIEYSLISGIPKLSLIFSFSISLSTVSVLDSSYEFLEGRMVLERLHDKLGV